MIARENVKLVTRSMSVILALGSGESAVRSGRSSLALQEAKEQPKLLETLFQNIRKRRDERKGWRKGMEKREKGGSAIRGSAEHHKQSRRDFIYPDAWEAKSNQTQTENALCLPPPQHIFISQRPLVPVGK